jgi:small subunit ribosomal protein S21
MENIHIKIDEKNGVERCLRKFKRLCDSYGIVKQYRARQEYKKPSIKKLEKSENAEKRRRKTVSKGFRRSKI